MHHDQDPVYTVYAWTSQLLLDDGVRISCALNGSRDNPEVEGFISHLKGGGRSLFRETEAVDNLRQTVARHMAYYNGARRHSSIGYRSPLAYLRQVRYEMDC